LRKALYPAFSMRALGAGAAVAFAFLLAASGAAAGPKGEAKDSFVSRIAF